MSLGPLHRLLEQQSYRLAHWRIASSDINYRRFFDVNSLAGLRVELSDVFTKSHDLLFRLIGEGRLPYMIRTPDAIRQCHLHLSLAKVFQGFGMNAEGNHYRELSTAESKRYVDAYGRLSVQLDQAQLGIVDNPMARTSATGMVVLNGSHPPAFRRGVYSRWGI